MAAFLAILASLFLAIGAICSRRGSLLASPTQGARITVLLGPPLFAVLAFSFGELTEWARLPLLAYVFFAAAGVLHFILGRSLQYLGVQSIGAARASVVITLAPLVSVAIAIPLFGEGPGWPTAVGAVLLILGPILVATGERRYQMYVGIEKLPAGPKYDLARGVVMSLGAAAIWGVTPILVKAGLNEAEFPVLGTFISYTAAALVSVGLLGHGGTRHRFLGLDRQGVFWYVLAGIAVSLAHFVRYVALNVGEVTVVVLMMQLVPLFVFVLTWLLNRQIETLNAFLIAGGVCMVAGSAIVVGFGTGG